MRNNDYLKLKKLAKYISRLMRSGQWSQLADKRRVALQTALKRLMFMVQNRVSKRHLVRAMGAAAFLVSTNANAQSFIGPEENPFGIKTIETYFVKPEFADIDADGDLDYFMSNPEANKIYYQENIGSATAPEFADTVANPFSLDPSTGSFAPIFGDLDDDGDLDMLSTNYDDGTAMYYENTGTDTDPVFDTEVISPFGLEAVYFINSDFVDIDDDGDLDIMGVQYNEDDSSVNIYFIENSGTAEAPAFEAPVVDPFGITVTSTDYFSFIDFVDLDEDGDMDFFRCQIYGEEVHYHENTGTASEPEFGSGSGLGSPFGIDALGPDQYFTAPTTADIDGDGDYDFFATSYYGPTLFYENRTYVASIADPGENNFELSVYPNPANDVLRLNTSLTNEEVQEVAIYGLDGRNVYRSQLLEQEIATGNFVNGMYLLEITTVSGNKKQLKFVKE